MKLSNRLLKVAEFVDQDSVVGDIGSDHGYILVYLMEKGMIKKAIASDINLGPVLNLKETVEKYQLKERIDIRHAGGFKPYQNGDIDTAIIAGMGGILIKNIIKEDFDLAKSLTLILQPMTHQNLLREYLCTNGFSIESECIAREKNRFYEIMKVCYTGIHSSYTELDYEIGINMIKDDLYKEFIEFKINKYEMIYKKFKNEQIKTTIDRLRGLYD